MVAVAAGAAVVLLGAGLYALFARGDGSASAALPAGVWVATASSPDEPAAPLVITNVRTGERRQFGPAAFYAAPTFSPDGTRLTAIGRPSAKEPDAWYLWDAATGKELQRQGDLVGRTWWSPDSRIVVVGTMPQSSASQILTLDRDGQRIAAEPLQIRDTQGLMYRNARGEPWSSSGTFALTDGATLVVVDSTGTITRHDADALGLAPGYNLADGVWLGDQLQLSNGSAAGTTNVRVTFSSGGRVARVDPVVPPRPPVDADLDAFQRMLRQRYPGQPVVENVGRTGDRRYPIAAIRGSLSSPDATVVALVDGTWIDVPFVSSFGFYGAPFSLLVVGK